MNGAENSGDHGALFQCSMSVLVSGSGLSVCRLPAITRVELFTCLGLRVDVHDDAREKLEVPAHLKLNSLSQVVTVAHAKVWCNRDV